MTDEAGTPTRGEKRESPERLLYFTDAVVAIALTLLVIDLPLPAADTEHAFFKSIQVNDGHYLAFVVSFVVVAMAWRSHKRMSALIVRGDSSFEVRTLIWLFTVALIPFATKLLTVGHHASMVVHACCYGFYALVEATSSLMVVLSLHHARRVGQIEMEDLKEASDLQRSSLGRTIGFALSIPIFFLTMAAWVVWIIVPLTFGSLTRLARGRSRREEVLQ